MVSAKPPDEVAEAQYNLGWMYANGEGVAQDEREAIYGIAKPPDRGLPKRNIILG